MKTTTKITKKRYAQITKKRDGGGKCQCRRGGSVNAVRTTGLRRCVATPALQSKPFAIGENLASVGGEGGVRCAVRYECLMNAFFSPPNLAFRSIFDPSFLFPNFSQNLYGQLTWQKITSFAFQRSIFEVHGFWGCMDFGGALEFWLSKMVTRAPPGRNRLISV